MDRRAMFFMGAALVCFAIAPIGHDEHAHVAIVVGCIYVVFAFLSFLDFRSRRGRHR